MDYTELLGLIIDLEFDKPTTIFTENNVEIYVIRPIKKFKNYDVNKNFQIFIKEGSRVFRPNHLRVMIDLQLKVRSRPDLKYELLTAFDKIFYKENSLKVIGRLKNEKFEHFLNSISVIAILSQLFILEQEYNYESPSNFDPPTLFFQGWIRQFIDSTKEIDNLVMSVCSRQPPAAKYTAFENKNNKKYQANIKSLWYINNP
jgi:hypothetical protein